MSYFDKCKVKFVSIKGEDLSDSEYFSRPGISNSRLKLINPKEGGSPKLFKDPPAFEYNPSLQLGSAVHQLLLQPNDYILSDYDGKPSGKCGVFVDLVYELRQKNTPLYKAIQIASEQADYYKGAMSPARIKSAISLGLDYYLRRLNNEFVSLNKKVIVLPKAQLITCKSCLRSLSNNHLIQNILKQNIYEPKEYLNEIALFSDIEVTLPDGTVVPLQLKGKFDSVVLDPENKTCYLNDLKTTSKQIEYFMDTVLTNDDGEQEAFSGVFSHHHYWRQLFLYSFMLQMYLDHCLYKADYNIKCNIFAVETTGENKSQLFKINNSYIQEGKKEFKELICRVAYHKVNGYDSEPV